MRVGFFYGMSVPKDVNGLHSNSETVKNHGIPDNVVDDTIQVAKDFFALPLAQKMEVRMRILISSHLLISSDRSQETSEFQGIFCTSQRKQRSQRGG